MNTLREMAHGSGGGVPPTSGAPPEKFSKKKGETLAFSRKLCYNISVQFTYTTGGEKLSRLQFLFYQNVKEKSRVFVEV